MGEVSVNLSLLLLQCLYAGDKHPQTRAGQFSWQESHGGENRNCYESRVTTGQSRSLQAWMLLYVGVCMHM